MKKIIRSILSIVIASTFVTQPLYAIGGVYDEVFYKNNNILNYDPRASNEPCTTTGGSSVSQTGDLDSFLKALAMQESGGNPTAANPDSSARGKYQYLTDTWQSRFESYPPANKYSSADKAPEEIQDAVAYIEYSKKWKEFNGSIFKLAISHFYPAANSDLSLLDQHIGTASNPTPREYADSVVKKINEGYGSEIPLKYSSAPDFSKYSSGSGNATTPTTTSASQEGCSSSGVGGAVTEGGLTEDQGKTFVMNYGRNTNGDSAKFTYGNWNNCKGGGANCVTFSQFFINKFSSEGQVYVMGNGGEVVGNLKAKGVPTGSTPKVFSIFSWRNDSYGHTGVVLGASGDEIIVGHASCDDSIPGVGDGTTLTKGAAIIRKGKANDPNVWLGKVPTEFAYIRNVDTTKVEGYINGKL